MTAATPATGTPSLHGDWSDAAGNTALPMLGFGTVRHRRLHPRVHAFRYPTYFLMLPLRSMSRPGSHAADSPLAWNRRSALSFYDVDHGDGRPPQSGGALAWLDETLRREGIHDATGETWLHCYPRVFGFAFKPVSFWYCHRAREDQNGALRAILVEVNNTFGERHCYLLDTPSLGGALHAAKVFHVSPFLEPSGSYQFRFLHARRDGAAHIVACVDYACDGRPTLQTSVGGRLEPLTPRSIRRALTHYPLMTLAVVLRIHWQALRLWLKGVAWRSKPAAPQHTVTR